MRIRLNKAVIEEINDGNLKRFDIDVSDLRYERKHLWVDVEEIGEERATELHKLLAKATAFGSKAARHELGKYLTMVEEMKNTSGTEGFANLKVNKVEHFATYMRRTMLPFKQHRLYERDAKRGVMLCYYVYDIDYHPASRQSRDYTIPEHVTFRLGWKEFGEEMAKALTFYYNDVVNQTVKKVLFHNSLYLPDVGQDALYQESLVKFDNVMNNVGEQYLAHGYGTDDVDSESSSRYWWRSSAINLERNGEPSNVVIDVFKESDEESSNRRNRREADLGWWERLALNVKDGSPEDSDPEQEESLPVHPNLVVFALKKQVRLRVHIEQLTKYVYDKSLGDKLVLPQESINLVKTLVSWKGGFQDIIQNKGGGAVVLCAGIPGTGKTLTAEVYAEVMEKPLYTVQCSQLGTDPDELEKQLLTVFARSERWKAILLLDEADVYIRERGDDLNQNAIVGVFLRVLEYYNGVLFMTTNRPDIIDDAIASRCIAKITYEAPTVKNAVSIWKVLATIQGLKVTDAVVKQLAKKYEGITGRDIKNILKLVKLVRGEKNTVTVEAVDFVYKFKPTV